jgi:hypothetical protein
MSIPTATTESDSLFGLLCNVFGRWVCEGKGYPRVNELCENLVADVPMNIKRIGDPRL